MLYNSWKNISRTHGASEAWSSIILPPLALRPTPRPGKSKTQSQTEESRVTILRNIDTITLFQKFIEILFLHNCNSVFRPMREEGAILSDQ